MWLLKMLLKNVAENVVDNTCFSANYMVCLISPAIKLVYTQLLTTRLPVTGGETGESKLELMPGPFVLSPCNLIPEETIVTPIWSQVGPWASNPSWKHGLRLAPMSAVWDKPAFMETYLCVFVGKPWSV